MIKSFIALILCFLTCFEVEAARDGDGLSVEGAIGIPSVAIENPTGSEALYSGLAFEGKINLPVLSSGAFDMGLVGNFRYLDLKNTSNSEPIKEIGKHQGFGIGLLFGFGRLFLGVNMMSMKASHFTVGSISNELEYSYSPLNYTLGFRIPMAGGVKVGFAYSVTTGNVPKDESDLSIDSPFSETTYFVTFTWESAFSFGGFAKGLISDRSRDD